MMKRRAWEQLRLCFMPKRARLNRLYAELCRLQWPGPPQIQYIPVDAEGMIQTVVRPPITPERIAGIICDPDTIEGVRYVLLEANEGELWRLLRTRGGAGVH